MKLNVVMPVYNGAITIRRTVDSILNQNYLDFTFLIVNDCSTDATLENLYEWQVQDNRIKIIESGINQGIVGALNMGLNNLDEDCQYIARIDCGDICEKSRLFKQVTFLDNHPEVSLVGTEFKFFCENSELSEGILRFQYYSNNLHTHEEIKRDFTVMSPFAHPTLVFRRNIFLETGPYTNEYEAAEDYEIVGRTLSYGYRVAKIPEVLLQCEFTPNQGISQTKRENQVKSALKIKLDFIYNNFLPTNINRNVYIWGTKDFAGYLEEELREKKYHTTVKAFTDFDQAVWGQVKNGLPIISPDKMIKSVKKDDIVITMWNIGRESIMEFLDNHGLQRNNSYFVFS